MGPSDVQGLNQMLALIEAKYPPDQFWYVSLGASADPITVGLSRRRHMVKVIPVSEIPSWDGLRSRGSRNLKRLIDYIRNQCFGGWPPVSQSLVLIDAMSSGAALTTMQKLIWAIDFLGDTVDEGSIAAALHQVETVAHPRSVRLFALNDATKAEALALVAGNEVAAPEKLAATPEAVADYLRYVKIRFLKQSYKDETRLGRLFAKNRYHSIDPGVTAPDPAVKSKIESLYGGAALQPPAAIMSSSSPAPAVASSSSASQGGSMPPEPDLDALLERLRRPESLAAGPGQQPAEDGDGDALAELDALLLTSTTK
jgi:hypothetical protein